MSSHTEYNRGWDTAYQQHLAAIEKGGPLAALWQDPPIPFLQDRDVLRLLRDNHVDTILEPGCGDGRNSRHLDRMGFHVTAVDISEAALLIASHRAAQDGHNRIVHLQQDVSHMNFVGESFDAVVCADTLGQIEHPEAALAEFKRLLHPGGVLLFNLFTPEDSTCGVGEQIAPLQYMYKGTLFRFFTREMVLQLLTGWTLLSIRQYPWLDPPHGDFRPEAHMHDSWVVTALKLS
jgi:ubiquinone/menaquinone biosynthesis C-methylase UbiE